MSLLDSILGMFGNTDNLKDQVTGLGDRNQDGQLDMADLGELKDAADLNKDGSVNPEDLSAIKDKLQG